MKPNSLLFLVNHFRIAGSGLENDSVKLCRAMSERGYDVHVCCGDGDSRDGMTVHVGLDARDQVIAEVHPDLVIDWEMIGPADIHRMGTGTHRGFLPYNLERCTGIAKFIKGLTYKLPKHTKKIAREQAILQHPGDNFLPNSKQTAKMAIEDGADPGRVDVYYQSVDLEEFSPANRDKYRSEIRKQFDIAEDDVVFMFAAHNLGLKNFALLEKVFHSMEDSSGMKVMVIGKRDPGVSAPWMVYAGTTDRMNAMYAASDVFVHPTWFDSCANVVIEAMASGLPILVSNTSGVYEIVRDGEDGCILDVIGEQKKIQDTWKAAILKLAKDAELRATQGANARRNAEGHSFARYLDWFEEYMVKVLARKPGR